MGKERESITTEEFILRLDSESELRSVELCDADLSMNTVYNLVLQNCVFVNTDLTDADWEGARCSSCRFINCRFLDAILDDAVFERCVFFDPNLSKGCDFTRAKLRSASFSECDISSCIFEGAEALRISIQHSKAVGAKFFRTRFDGAATITGNMMRYVDLRGANLSKCDLSQNDLVWASLDEGDFQEANLMGSDLNGATMRYAKFAGADMRGAVLASFDIRTMDMQGVKIFESQMRQLIENCEIIVFPDSH